jgi:hypothetical protein
MPSVGNRIPDLLIAGTFLFSATMKLATISYPPGDDVLLKSHTAIFGISAIELLMALGLFTRHRVWALRASLGFVVAGVWAVFLARMFTSHASAGCSCFGRAPLTDTQHLVLATCILTVAWIGLRRAGSGSPDSAESPQS